MGVTDFGKYLRARRNAANLSLRAVADAIGVSHVYLGEVERGARKSIPQERWDRIVAAIPGVTFAELERCAQRTAVLGQLNLEDAPPQYQELGLALARRLQNRDMKDQEIHRLLRMLRGAKDE